MAAAVHRSGDEREPWNAAESLTVREALAASTDGWGTVAVGHPGDLVLLDNDPLLDVGDSAATSAHLRAMSVAATYVAVRLIAPLWDCPTAKRPDRPTVEEGKSVYVSIALGGTRILT